jgi:hypothetical protein
MLSKVITVLIALLYSINAYTQQRILFINNRTNEKKQYQLPCKVEFRTPKQKLKKMILISVINDSLIFRSTEKDSTFLSYNYLSLPYIKFNKKNEDINSFGATLFGGATLLFGALAVTSAAQAISGDNNYVMVVGLYLGTPLAVINGLIAYSFYKGVPKEMNKNTWQLIH